MEAALSSQADRLDLKSWVGRREEAVDLVTAGPVAALAALLDYETAPWPSGALPPLAHWFYCLNRTRQAALDADGHEKRGGFLPPTGLPRRMWAGGALSFHHPVRLGSVFRRSSVITEVSEKLGRSGPLLFVAIDHRLEDSKGLAIRERQDLVYRGPARKDDNTITLHTPPSRDFDWERTIAPDPVLLFRYSALTFNAHRIHFDRDFCLNHEGYPGLVVHGPLIATLLADLYLRHNPGAELSEFSYRAQSPLFDTAPFQLRGRATTEGAELWALAPDGQVAMTAQVKAG
ncbi:MAG: MaoC family dehydratase N-terminal domain-containing protein [Alphaproteobacteria bacterium]|nr:MaoC family dehydratase N-terminal domain-containing protein [Alphaproteobacteria bacterium]